jgi:geranylgeranyl diphosphate synthase type I
MVIHALRQPESNTKATLLSVLGKGDDASQEEIDAGLKALADLGSIDYARERAVSYHAKAHECLNQIPDGPALRALRELTDFQLERIS